MKDGTRTDGERSTQIGAPQASASHRAPSTGERRARMSGRRPVSVLVRVTEDEKRWLAERAGAAGLSVPAFLMESAQAVTSRQTASQRRATIVELENLRRLLANLSNNVNQIARSVDAGADPSRSGQLDAALTSVDSLRSRIRQVVEDLAS